MIESKLSDDQRILVISIKGIFDFSMLGEFREAYSGDIDKSVKVIIDMRDTLSINSSALGMLLNMQRSLGKEDGEIEIINCNETVQKVFNITHFNKKFLV